MIKALREDLTHKNDRVRGTVARALAVVSASLGLEEVLPFLQAVCLSKNAEARHTGCKVIQQVALMMGASVLRYLGPLVQCLKPNLKKSGKKIMVMASLAIS